MRNGWHKALKSIFTMSHPALGHFLTEMREEILRHQSQALRLIRGIVPINERQNHVVQTEIKVMNAKKSATTIL